jgi:hypothetical protein
LEIAIGGLVLFVLLLPGISFNKGYFSGEFSRNYISTDFFGLLVNTIFPSLILYLLAFPIIYFSFGYFYNIQVFLGVISSNDDLVKSSIQTLDKFKLEITSFQIIINILAYIIGKLSRDLILKYSLDTKTENFKFDNIWHYLISARFLEINNILINDSPEDVDLTFVDALVSIDGNTFIYTGILLDYQLGKDGTLDLLIISKAQRKMVTGNNSGTYKDISGNYLVLKYSDLLNLNFSFIQFDETLDNNGNITAVQARIIN